VQTGTCNKQRSAPPATTAGGNNSNLDWYWAVSGPSNFRKKEVIRVPEGKHLHLIRLKENMPGITEVKNPMALWPTDLWYTRINTGDGDGDDGILILRRI